MNLLKLIFVLAVAGIVYIVVSKPHAARATESAAAAPQIGDTGFVSMPAAPVKGRSVVVYAAEGCPEAAAQRADALADQLAQQGIPVTRMAHFSMNIPGNDPAAAQEVLAFMKGELPIVFIGQRAKSNPALDDVVAEYRTARR